MAGYLEIEHTADWELEVWAPDLAALLEQAARGMAVLSGIRLKDGPRQNRMLNLQAEDAERLLVAFLSELLWMGESEGLGFDRYDFQMDRFALQVEMEGAPIASLAKEIKAVTFHKLAIRSGERGLEANIVFDV